VPIDTLALDPRNARVHPQANRDAIRKSLATFGQQKPVVVDSHGFVPAGNGTLEQARDLGWTHLARTRSDLPAAQLKAYALADNTSGDLAEWDPDELRSQLEELADEDFDLDAAGLAFSEDELDAFIGADTTPAQAPASGGGPEAGDSSPPMTDQWKIVITCANEQQQTELLHRFDAENLSCRALVS
jgi:ParB-like chromosome segregation protein Spo0J